MTNTAERDSLLAEIEERLTRAERSAGPGHHPESELAPISEADLRTLINELKERDAPIRR